MKAAGIKRVMASFGCTADTPTRIKELRTINLRSDGNQSVTPENDEITFDVDNELIKIKEYSAKPISGIIATYTLDGKTLSNCRFVGSNLFKSTVAPEEGDSIIYISKSDSSVKVVGKIVTLVRGVITADKELPDVSGYYIGYINGEKYAVGSQCLRDPRFFVIYEPISEFATDIYLSFFSVVGFSTVSQYYGV